MFRFFNQWSIGLVLCFISIPPTAAQTWTKASTPSKSWWSIASSADGTKLVALVGGMPYPNVIFTSSDSGANWNSKTVPSLQWWSVASSADGTKLVAVTYGSGAIFTSTDSGSTWVSNSAPSYPWFSVASSADGTKLVAVTGGGQVAGPIYNSTNSGITWISNNVPNDFWNSVASSADGNKLIATASTHYYTTANAGATWLSNSLPSVTWMAVASGADGNKVVASAIIGGIHRLLMSTNSGATWRTNDLAIGRVGSLASSADASELLAVEADIIWSTTNSGISWTSNYLKGFWHSVAMSADGAKSALADASPGGIWTSQSMPSPRLTLLPGAGSLIASWIVPSTNFVLQQTANLEVPAWTDVTNVPLFNASTVQYEVQLGTSNRNGFYRLGLHP